MALALDLIIIALMLGVVPSLAVQSFKGALNGEPMGYLLGTLLSLAVVTTISNLPIHYQFAGIFFGIIGLTLACYFGLRNVK